MLYFLQQLLNGVHSGALYALLAFGYALTNGVAQAHQPRLWPDIRLRGTGADPRGGVRLARALADLAGDGWLGIVAGLGLCGAHRHRAVRSVFGPLASSSPNAIVVATLGVALVLMELGAHRRRDPRFLAAADARHAGDLRRRRTASGSPSPSSSSSTAPSPPPPSPPLSFGLAALAASGAPGGRSATIPPPPASVASTSNGCSMQPVLGRRADRRPRRLRWPALYFGNISFGTGWSTG